MTALAANYDDDEDPPEMYKLDVLRDPREEEDRLLVESYVETVNRIEGISTAGRFCVEYPEISRVLNYLDGSADDVAQKIFSLYHRHAQQVCGALDAAGRAAISELRRGELPATSLLSIAFAKSRKLSEVLPDTARGIDSVEQTTEDTPATAVASGNESEATITPTADGGQWFSDDPPKDSKFGCGPLEGSLKDLAAWMDMDQRTIRRLNGETSWWVKRVHGKKYAAWFSTQERYAAANQKRVIAESQNRAK